MIYLLSEMAIALIVVLFVGAIAGYALAQFLDDDGPEALSADQLADARAPLADIAHDSMARWLTVAAATSRDVALKLIPLGLSSTEDFLRHLERYDTCSQAAEDLEVEDFDLMALRDVAQLMTLADLSAEDVLWLGSKNIFSTIDLAKINAVDIQDETIDDAKLSEIQLWVSKAKIHILK